MIKIEGNLAFLHLFKHQKKLDAVLVDHYDRIHFLRSGYGLKVFGEDNEVLWEGVLDNDSQMVLKKGKGLGLIPKGVDYYDWNKWLDSGNSAILIIPDLPDLEEPKGAA